ncbi:GntR family transcriptional regulator [Streptomyces sp. NPDC002896]|uniref:FadR/GntR family transcriptional regulator n=1 Tax=Streptomyces sp. NPDC002896 TaxID=3154438 RepID=UPI003332E620
MPQLRQPRLAEMVAAKLREDILSGRLKEGDSLPRQEDLYAEFKVSLPAVREAMRILETEGLISVRRGNVGGAVVHEPTADRIAYMVSMVLQTRATSLDDVSGALLHLEPVCAGMCAARPDRESTVLPALRTAVEAQQAAFEDPGRYSPLARRFHEELVEHCGNETMIVLIGSLESIWSAHESSVWGAVAGDGRTQEPGSPMSASTRRAAIRDHEKLIAAIEAGNVTRAVTLARTHLTATRASTLASEDLPLVKASTVSGSRLVG